MFEVNYWGSHPDDDNDDCWAGEEFETKEEALKAYAAPVTGQDADITAYVEISGPGGYGAVRRNPDYDQAAQDAAAARFDREWLRERAMEAGMAFGCEGFNDVMGY